MNQSPTVLDKVNKNDLLQRASSLANGSPCHFIGNPIHRSDQIILKIYFPDKAKTWAAKIPFDQECPFYGISVQPLELLANWHPQIPAPRVHGYVDVDQEEEEGEGESKVGVVYMLMEWIDGKPMQPWSLNEPPVEARCKVLDQIAVLMPGMLRMSAVDRGIRFYGTLLHAPYHHCESSELM